MADLLDSIGDLWKRMRSGASPLPEVATFPWDQCHPGGDAGIIIRRDEMYFSIRINEMHLAENREWWSLYDPLVIVVTEFNHGNETVTIPTVIGPNLIPKQTSTDQPRYGVVLLDIPVTGPHPYRGGNVCVSVAFYEVRRVDHAQELLKVVGSVSTALGGPGEIQSVAKAGDALLQGIETLLDSRATTYIAGQRIALPSSPAEPFESIFSALIAPPIPELSRLIVNERRRLCIHDGQNIQPYRGSDFVLLSITGSESRGDENLLPFFPLKLDAMTTIWDGDDGLKRAKAMLTAAYQQMRKDPNVTAVEAGRLFEQWLTEFQTEKDRLERTRHLPVAPSPTTTSAAARDVSAAMRRISMVAPD